jgi:hypothetical protein
MRVTDDMERLADMFDDQIDRAKKDFVVFLLGPGFPEITQTFRRDVKTELEERGYNAIIMREIKFTLNPKSANPLRDKFWHIVNCYHIELFVCVFPGDGQTHAVIQEVAYVEERCGSERATQLFRFCFSDDFSVVENLPQYTKNLLTGVNTIRYCELNPSCIAWAIARIIDNETREIAVRKNRISDCLYAEK